MEYAEYSVYCGVEIYSLFQMLLGGESCEAALEEKDGQLIKAEMKVDEIRRVNNDAVQANGEIVFDDKRKKQRYVALFRRRGKSTLKIL